MVGILSGIFGGEANNLPETFSMSGSAKKSASRIAYDVVSETRSNSRSGIFQTPDADASTYYSASQQRLSDLKNKAVRYNTFIQKHNGDYSYSSNDTNAQHNELLSMQAAAQEFKDHGIDPKQFASLSDQEISGISQKAAKNQGKSSYLFNGAALIGGIAIADQAFTGGEGIKALGGLVGLDIPSFQKGYEGEGSPVSLSGHFQNGLGEILDAPTSVLDNFMPTSAAKIITLLGATGFSMALMSRTSSEMGIGAGLGTGLALAGMIYTAANNSDFDVNWEENPVVGPYAEFANKISSGAYGPGLGLFK